MSRTKTRKVKKNVVVDTKDLLAAIQALTIFYEQKVQAFTAIREEYGEDHPATAALYEEIDTLGNILNFFTGLVGEQVKRDGEHFN